MALKRTICSLICFLIFSFYSHLIAAVWDPIICLDKDNLSSLEILQDKQFVTLKKQVFNYLRDSWCTEEKANLIMDLIALTKPQVCVEIGVFTGSSFLPLVTSLSFLKRGHAFAIDPWSNLEAIQGILIEDPNYWWWSNVNMLDVNQKFLNTMTNWRLSPYYTVINTSSRNALKQLDQIDFLHLDGNFSEKGSLEDVLLYLPKVSTGGYILMSNVLVTVNNKCSKMKSLWTLLEHCEMIAEIENSNAILFQKN